MKNVLVSIILVVTLLSPSLLTAKRKQEPPQDLNFTVLKVVMSGDQCGVGAKENNSGKRYMLSGWPSVCEHMREGDVIPMYVYGGMLVIDYGMDKKGHYQHSRPFTIIEVVQ